LWVICKNEGQSEPKLSKSGKYKSVATVLNAVIGNARVCTMEADNVSSSVPLRVVPSIPVKVDTSVIQQDWFNEGATKMSSEFQTTSHFDLSTSQRATRELTQNLLELIRSVNPSLDNQTAQALIVRAVAIIEPKREFSSFNFRSELARGGLAPWQMRKVACHIHENLERSIQTRQLAETINLSASYFTRAFKVSFGVVPSLYVTRLRIERAQRLLVETQDPICQIALDCGFSDQAHLSKRFREYVQDTPHHWRRQHCDHSFERKVA
jgi:AraC family transcriptional regulator